MKYFLTLLLCLAMAALAFAGNTGTVYQEGTNQAYVNQTGDNHNATVDQFGTNYAEVDQYGGNGNTADVDQGASGSNTSDAGPASYAGDWIGGAYVEQDGNSNSATIDINRGSAGARIFQQGDRNFGYQELNAAHSKTTNWDKMGLHIEQMGDDNWANQKTASHFGCYGIQGMYVIQQGSDNIANQYSKGGMLCTMEIKQVGDNNDYAVDVSTTGLASPLALSWAHKPAGDFVQYQTARWGTAHIDIIGDGNSTAQYQEYNVYTVSGQNCAYIDIIGSDNDVAQGQLGDYNDSDIDIDGDGNVVATSQLGDSNIADVDLVGASNDNIAAIQQTGDDHSATIYQNGASNIAKVIQQP